MDDDLRSLREWRAEIPEPGQEWIIPQRRRLLTRIRGRGRTLGRRLLLVGALGAAAALAVATLRPEPLGPNPANTPPVVQLDSNVVLAHAAEVVGRRKSTQVPLPTQWHYTKTLEKQPNSDTVRAGEGWMRYDGKQSASLGRARLGQEEGELIIRDVPPDPGDDDLSPQQYDAKLRELPTNPRKLLAKVTADRHWIDYPKEEGVPKSAAPDADRAYRVIMLYLSRYGSMPPRLEATLFRALALIPGVHVEQGVSDAAGRSGLGIWREPAGGGPRIYYILDRDTYRYLGARGVWLRDEFPFKDSEHGIRKGAVWSTALLSSVIVDRPGQRG
ncbi:CU044_5270 family protein [Streptosporangium sp. NBC_01639]|uniref:CU044_5270 family protein n=1 Tax=Streptosporangium sp. NBC_01639 TaxID=2975948 RepID=UPI003868AC76|nr:CU044_5270 family protein [Streptosporangium sp. NBC_01639]